MNLLTAREASNILRVAISTIYEYVKLGKIPAYKINGKILFKEHELIDFINNCAIPCKVKPKLKKEVSFKPSFTTAEEVLAKLNSL